MKERFKPSIGHIRPEFNTADSDSTGSEAATNLWTQDPGSITLPDPEDSDVSVLALGTPIVMQISVDDDVSAEPTVWENVPFDMKLVAGYAYADDDTETTVYVGTTTSILGSTAVSADPTWLGMVGVSDVITKGQDLSIAVTLDVEATGVHIVLFLVRVVA